MRIIRRAETIAVVACGILLATTLGVLIAPHARLPRPKMSAERSAEIVVIRTQVDALEAQLTEAELRAAREFDVAKSSPTSLLNREADRVWSERLSQHLQSNPGAPFQLIPTHWDSQPSLIPTRWEAKVVLVQGSEIHSRPSFSELARRWETSATPASGPRSGKFSP